MNDVIKNNEEYKGFIETYVNEWNLLFSSLTDEQRKKFEDYEEAVDDGIDKIYNDLKKIVL